MTLEVAMLTDVGRTRSHNEDAVGSPESMRDRIAPAVDLDRRGRLYAVADGMGGHARGEVASRLALEHLFAAYYQSGLPVREALRDAVRQANAEVYRAGHRATDLPLVDEPQAHMGTTLVAAVVLDDRVLLANVGDSRGYLLRRGDLLQVTRDHSLVADQVRAGALTASEAAKMPFHNILLRAIGGQEEVEPDLFEELWGPGDSLLLCSDGLHGVVPEGDIAITLRNEATPMVAAELVELANLAGGPDNISVVVVRKL